MTGSPRPYFTWSAGERALDSLRLEQATMTDLVERVVTGAEEASSLFGFGRSLGECYQVSVRFFALGCRIGIAGNDEQTKDQSGEPDAHKQLRNRRFGEESSAESFRTIRPSERIGS